MLDGTSVAECYQQALERSTGEVVVVLDPHDRLADGAIAALMDALATPNIAVAYGDHDEIAEDGRLVLPHYKPDFSPERLRHHDYIHHVAVERSALIGAGGFQPAAGTAWGYDALLRLAELGAPFAHVTQITHHEAAASSVRLVAPADGVRCVQEHCDRSGVAAVVGAGTPPGTYRLRRRPSVSPRVSVVIPTRGGTRPVWGVPRCFVVDAVRSLVDRSTYPDLEFVVVYDGVTPEPVLRALRRAAGERLVLVRYDEPFNFSHKINVGVAASSGELVLILNDDTELREPASVETMVAHLDDPTVGMVGPKLLFADGTIQDGGHVYHEHLLPGLVGWPGDGPGPHQLLVVEREVSGVTAAAALVRRTDYDEVGGFDESLPVNFNDVDFSLKMRATGRRTIWTPEASWFHFESQTRPPTARPEEFDEIERRWRDEINSDPYYHPELAQRRADWVERPLRSGAAFGDFDRSTWVWARPWFLGRGPRDGDAVVGRLNVLLAVWAVAVFSAVVAAHDGRTAGWFERSFGSLLPLLVLAALLAGAAVRRRWVLTSALLVAVAPTALVDLGSGWVSALLVLGGALAGSLVGPFARVARVMGGVVVVVSIGLGVAWWTMLPTGRTAAADVPVSAWAFWMLAAVAVAGVTLWSGVRFALLPVAAAAAIVIAAGPDGMFLFVGTLVFAAARVEAEAVAERRTVAAVSLLLPASWVVTAVDSRGDVALGTWPAIGVFVGSSAMVLFALSALFPLESERDQPPERRSI